MSDAVKRQAHWEQVYTSKAEHEVSWFQEDPSMSLDLIHASGVGLNASIIDIGAGESRLVDFLLHEKYQQLSVLDVAESALRKTIARLGSRASQVRWITTDVTTWEPDEAAYDLWHDRAAFHFLTERPAYEAYVSRLLKALRPSGHFIIGTFALDGPEMCSGLGVARHDANSLGAVLGSSFELIETRRHEHPTPLGRTQQFQFSWFRRV